MKLNLDYYTFNKMIKFINFENTHKHEQAEYFSITSKYLWRRDKNRLIAMALNESLPGNFNYKAQNLEDLAYGESVEITPDGVISYKDEGQTKEIRPVDIDLLPESLKIITAKHFDAEFRVSTEKLVRNLSDINKKYIAGGEGTFDEIILDLSNEKLIAKGKQTEQRDFKLKPNHSHKNQTLRFDYRMMRDLLINSGDFNHELLFRTVSPFVTIMVYNKHLFAALMHKKA